jgi:hypothetical protein
MGSIDYFRSATAELHQNLLDAVKSLTDEQLHFRPLDKGNHIAFMIWHCVRTEDLVINLMLQKKTPVWNEEGWDAKLELDPRSQGTGMSAEEAAALRINDLPAFVQYMEHTYSATNAYLSTLKEDDLDQVRDMPGRGKDSLGGTLGSILVRHGTGHLSEIWYVKGLLGLQGSPV